MAHAAGDYEFKTIMFPRASYPRSSPEPKYLRLNLSDSPISLNLESDELVGYMGSFTAFSENHKETDLVTEVEAAHVLVDSSGGIKGTRCTRTSIFMDVL